PFFLLNRRRRLLGVNQAWEQWTGSPAAEFRGLALKRYPNAQAGSREALAGALRPVPEALEGKPARVRRLAPPRGGGRSWCAIDYFPLRASKGRLRILGRITPLPGGATLSVAPLPEELVTLRESRVGRYRLDQLESRMPAFRRVVDQVRLAGQTRVPLLLVGEPGTG